MPQYFRLPTTLVARQQSMMARAAFYVAALRRVLERCPKIGKVGKMLDTFTSAKAATRISSYNRSSKNKKKKHVWRKRLYRLPDNLKTCQRLLRIKHWKDSPALCLLKTNFAAGMRHSLFVFLLCTDLMQYLQS